MSLRGRLVVALLSLASVGLLVADVVTYSSLRSFLYERVDDQLLAAREPVMRSLGREAVGARFPGPPGRGPGGGPPRPPLPAGTYGEVRRGGTVVAATSLGYGSEPAEGPTDLHLPASLPATFTSGPWRVRAEPLGLGEATLIVAAPLDEVHRTLTRLLRIAVLVSAAVLAGLAALAWWVVRLGLRPLEAMGATAGAIAAGDLTRRVEPADDRTEVGRLGRSLNAMLHQIEGAFAERTESEDRLRRFVADAAHELRTPLTSIRGYAELFRRGAADRPQDLAKSMQRIEAESDRMGVLVEDLLLLARLDQGRPLEAEPVDLASVASDAVDDARATDPDRPIDASGVSGPLVVVGDDGRLRQAVHNLVANALAHTPTGTPVEVTASLVDGHVVVAVIDHGPGIGEGDAPRVFDRFYRVDVSRHRDDGGGSGLGLSIVAAIAEAHGGRVQLEATPGGGATFRLVVPGAPPNVQLPAPSGDRRDGLRLDPMERPDYAPGTPMWIDLGADIPKAEAFYGGLFGWETTEAGSEEETGGYRMFTYRGKMVAGLGPQQAPGAPYWTTYICTDDADATAARVRQAGGAVFVEPMDVMDAGRMAIFADPTGAAFGVWQANQHKGAGLVNEPNTLVWNELQTRDIDAAKAFYPAVFGVGVGGAPEYVEWQVNGESVGAAMPMPPGVPDQVPSNWLTYFAVEDCEAAIERATSLGGSLVMGPMDVPVGRFAVLSDDQGSVFAVIKMSGEHA